MDATAIGDQKAAYSSKAKSTVKSKKETIPSLGEVDIAKLCTGQIDAYQDEARKAPVTLRRATMISHALVTAEGVRLYTSPADLAELASWDGEVGEAICDKFAAMNGLSPKG